MDDQRQPVSHQAPQNDQVANVTGCSWEPQS
jgi:hypothetical protein